MKKAVTLSALALVLLSGCAVAEADAGTAPEAAPAASASAGSAAPAPVQAQDSEEGTCLKLLGSNGDGPLSKATNRVTIYDGTSGYQGTPETGRVLLAELDAITASAPQDMEASLLELSSPVRNSIELAEGTTTFWGLDVETWQGAVEDLRTRCAPYGP